jgi:hypothetical protein
MSILNDGDTAASSHDRLFGRANGAGNLAGRSVRYLRRTHCHWWSRSDHGHKSARQWKRVSDRYNDRYGNGDRRPQPIGELHDSDYGDGGTNVHQIRGW